MTINYIEKEDFLKELRILKRTNTITEKLHLIFFEISTKYATINSFRNYTYIEDMVSEAYLKCAKVADKFDIENRSNPFAYFTTVIHRTFLNYIAKEKNQQKKKWIELKKTLEIYKIENGIDMPMPKGIMERIEEIS